jgi:hypothetical protein
MNYRISNIIILFFLTVAMNTSFAAPPSQQSLEELIRVTGTDEIMKINALLLVSGLMEGVKKKIPKEELNEQKQQMLDLLQTKLQEAYEYSQLKDDYISLFKSRVTEEDVQKELEWCRSELGQRIIQAFAKANFADMTAMLRDEDKMRSQGGIIAIASEMDQADGSIDSAVDLQVKLGYIITVDIAGKDISDLERAAEKESKSMNLDAIRQSVTKNYQARLIYALKDFSEEDRVRYLSYKLKPSTIKSTKAYNESFNKVFVTAMYNFKRAYQDTLKKPTPQHKNTNNQNSPDSTGTKNMIGNGADW